MKMTVIIDADLADDLRIEQIKSASKSIYSENEMNVLTLEDSIADLAGTPRPAHPAQDVEARVTAAYRRGLEDAAKVSEDTVTALCGLPDVRRLIALGDDIASNIRALGSEQ